MRTTTTLIERAHARHVHELHFGDADVHARLERESTVERFDADPFILRADGSVVERATGEVVSVALTTPSDLRSIIGSDPGTHARQIDVVQSREEEHRTPPSRRSSRPTSVGKRAHTE
jgi:hypothetical protein